MTAEAQTHTSSRDMRAPLTESAASGGGLSSEQAAQRLAEQGPNEIQRGASISPLCILLGQFKGALIWLLLAACVISALLGETTDAFAIAAILVINAFVGFFQEYRAERVVVALRAMTAPRARVLRDGRSVVIPAREVVVDDIVLLEAGDVVPADARLVEARQLSTLEAALTGESRRKGHPMAQVTSKRRATPGSAPALAPGTALTASSCRGAVSYVTLRNN